MEAEEAEEVIRDIRRWREARGVWMRSGLGGRTIIKPVRTASRRASLFPKCIIIYMEPFVLWSILIFPSGCAKEQNGVTDCSFSWVTLRGGAVVARQVNKVA